MPSDTESLAGNVPSVNPADHATVAAAFRSAQATSWSEFREHARLANYYRPAKLVGEAVHCEREARVARQASDEAAAAAAVHSAMTASNR